MQAGDERLHAMIHLGAEGSHRLQIVTGEVQLPMLLMRRGSGERGPVGWRLMVTTRSALASSPVLISLGQTPVRVMPRSARAVTTVGFRASAGSVPAESAAPRADGGR
jgi:hypothetical protein